jgi:hypothetical protein
MKTTDLTIEWTGMVLLIPIYKGSDMSVRVGCPWCESMEKPEIIRTLNEFGRKVTSYICSMCKNPYEVVGDKSYQLPSKEVE